MPNPSQAELKEVWYALAAVLAFLRRSGREEDAEIYYLLKPAVDELQRLLTGGDNGNQKDPNA